MSLERASEPNHTYPTSITSNTTLHLASHLLHRWAMIRAGHSKAVVDLSTVVMAANSRYSLVNLRGVEGWGSGVEWRE